MRESIQFGKTVDHCAVHTHTHTHTHTRVTRVCFLIVT